MASAKAKACFARTVRACRKYSRRRGWTGKSYHDCMSGTLKTACYGHRKRKRKKKR
jgi:hypothetical protein